MSTRRFNTGTISIVAQQEVRARVRQKSFLISAAILVVAVVGGIVAMHVVQDRDQTYEVAVVDAGAGRIVKAADAKPDQVTDVAAAERRVEDGKADAALIASDDGYQLIGDDEVAPKLSSALTVAIQTLTVERNAQAQDVDLQALNAGTQVDTRLLDPNADESGERQGVAFVMVLLFFGVALTFGMFIAQSVTAEKESRVVEILAAAVPLRDLLWGKIIANSALALAQVAVTVAAAVLALWATDQAGVLSVVTGVAWWYLAFFVLGFVALAGIWAVAGSMAARQQDLSSTTTPVMILLFVPYFISTLASGRVVEIVSMVPVASAMVMPSRLATETVPLWQTLTALGLNVVATVVLVALAVKAYERTVMRTERVTGFRELLSR